MDKAATKIPSHTDFKFNIKAGSKIKIETIFGNSFEGYVETNPNDAEVGYCISLYKSYAVTTDANGNNQFIFMNVLRFFLNEILEVRVLSPPPEKDLSRCHLKVDVQIIDQENGFMAAMLELNKADSIGFNMFGSGLGRNAEIGWVCFYANGVLVALDAIELSTLMFENEFWGPIKDILESNAVRKIVHDSRLIEDYLKQKKDIRLKNYDDLTALDMDIRVNKVRKLHKKFTEDVWIRRPLSALLAEYMPKKVNKDELKLLKKRELGRVDSPQYVNRPFISPSVAAKILVIRVKYVLELKREMMAVRNKIFVQLQKDQMDALLMSGTFGPANALVAPYEVTEEVKNLIVDAVHKS